MSKPRALILFAVLAAAPMRAQDDLPKHGAGEPMDFEPKLMLDGPRAAIVEPSPAVSLEDRVTQLEATLLAAERAAAEAGQLFKDGVLAKVEAEGRELRVVEIRKKLADARLAVAAANAGAAKKSFDAHQGSQSDVDAANAALKTALETATAASADWNKARLAAAELDLKRKRMLYAEGAASRREVQLAQDHLALLSGTAAR